MSRDRIKMLSDDHKPKFWGGRSLNKQKLQRGERSADLSLVVWIALVKHVLGK